MSVVIDQERETPRLYILSGVHQGGVAPLASHARYRIGASIDGDIVLRDQDIAAHHITLELNADKVRLTSHAAQVNIERRPSLAPGDTCEHRLPLTFSVGAVRMRVAGATPPEKPAGGLTAMGTRTMLPVLAILLGSLLFALLYIPGMASETTYRPDAAIDHRATPRVAIDVVREQLQTRLTDAGLGNLQIDTVAGQFNVSGEVSEPARTQWHGVQVWFDRTYGASYQLRSNLTLAQAPDLFIKAIWLGEAPYIVADSGERRYPGAVLADGWVLEKIGVHELVLARNGRQHVLRY